MLVVAFSSPTASPTGPGLSRRLPLRAPHGDRLRRLSGLAIPHLPSPGAQHQRQALPAADRPLRRPVPRLRALPRRPAAAPAAAGARPVRGPAAERRRLLLLLAVPASSPFAFNFLSGGDYRPGFRYFIPTLPVLMVAVWYGYELLAAGRKTRASRAPGPPPRGAAAGPARKPAAAPWLAAGGLSTGGSIPSPTARTGESGSPSGWTRTCPRTASSPSARWAASLITWRRAGTRSPSSTPWAWWTGRWPEVYRFDRKLKDLFRDLRAGRSSPEALEKGRRERANRLAEVVLARHPDFILIETALDDYGMMKALVASPELKASYRLTGQLPPVGQAYVRIYSRL